jgi:hypothetical protein
VDTAVFCWHAYCGDSGRSDHRLGDIPRFFASTAIRGLGCLVVDRHHPGTRSGDLRRPYTRLMLWHRPPARLVLFVGLLFAVGIGCGPVSRTLDPIDSALCHVAPAARQIPTEVRAALAAGRRGDTAAMRRSATRLKLLATEVGDAISLLGVKENPTPDIVGLISLELFAQQLGFFFEKAEADGLLSLEANLPALDVALAQFEDGLPGC